MSARSRNLRLAFAHVVINIGTINFTRPQAPRIHIWARVHCRDISSFPSRPLGRTSARASCACITYLYSPAAASQRYLGDRGIEIYRERFLQRPLGARHPPASAPASGPRWWLLAPSRSSRRCTLGEFGNEHAQQVSHTPCSCFINSFVPYLKHALTIIRTYFPSWPSSVLIFATHLDRHFELCLL